MKELLGQLAPTIATALGGPAAGTAIKFLANKLLGRDDATQDEIAHAVENATPEQLAKLKEIDNDFKIEMKRLDLDIERLYTEDTQNARGMAKDTSLAPQISLSIIFIGGYFGVLYMLFSGHIEINDSIRDMGNILLGVLTANIPQIMAFWFGSSSSSKQKTALMGSHK
jgi:hypothetical protein